MLQINALLEDIQKISRMDAIEEIKHLSSKNVETLQGWKNPPDIVRRALEAVYLVFNASPLTLPEPPMWLSVQDMLKGSVFISQLLNFDVSMLRSAIAIRRFVATEYLGVTEQVEKHVMVKSSRGSAIKSTTPSRIQSCQRQLCRTGSTIIGGAGNHEPVLYVRIRRSNHTVAALLHWCVHAMKLAAAPLCPDNEQIKTYDQPRQKGRQHNDDDDDDVHLGCQARCKNTDDNTARPAAMKNLADNAQGTLINREEEILVQEAGLTTHANRLPALAELVVGMAESTQIGVTGMDDAREQRDADLMEQDEAAFREQLETTTGCKRNVHTSPGYFETLVTFSLGSDLVYPELEATLETVAATIQMRRTLRLALIACGAELDGTVITRQRLQRVQQYFKSCGIVASATVASATTLRPKWVHSSREARWVLCRLYMEGDKEISDYFYGRVAFPSSETIDVAEWLEDNFEVVL